LILAGLGSDELGLGDNAMGVEAVGFAADLQPLYAEARIALCPLHIASGTRIKIIEAAMFGRAAISTSIGAEGLAFAPGREIALADDAPAFAQACIELLGDQERSIRMGMAARETARRLYSPAATARQLAAICAEALAG
jgi:glycosyltransferase involved in cell wall biosynthesis